MKCFAGDMEQLTSALPQEYRSEFTLIFDQRRLVGSVSEIFQESESSVYTGLPNVECNWGSRYSVANMFLKRCTYLL